MKDAFLGDTFNSVFKGAYFPAGNENPSGNSIYRRSWSVSGKNWGLWLNKSQNFQLDE